MANTGENAYLELKAGGDAGGGSYNELTLARDITLNGIATEADASKRSGECKHYLPGQLDISIEGDAIMEATDTNGVAVLRAAFYGKSLVGVKCRHAGSTSAGVRFDAWVTQFTVNEPLEDTNTVSFKLVPASDIELLAAS